MWKIVKMQKIKDLTKVKTRLIELGYTDNEWLDKYLEIIEANLETKANRASTQAHHAIPVNVYWNSNEPYNRLEALKLARKDPVNFVVNLFYKDHLLVHSYLTLCTNLKEAQIRYEAQAWLRKRNSEIGSTASPIMVSGHVSAYRGKKYVYKIIDDEIINQIVSPEELPLLLEEGWSLGREPKTKRKRKYVYHYVARCHINRNGEYKCITSKNLDKYLQDGWKIGASGKPRYKTEKIQK